jgi:hypothetical protein
MSADQLAAVERAHKALFKIDRLLAETYSPTPEVLKAMHDQLYLARDGLEFFFGVKP